MGNSPSDNQVVTHESGASRLGGSICCAVCCAPLLLLSALFLVGYNEKRAVCEARAISQGSDEVTSVGCDSATAGAGKLVLFSCDIKKDGLAALSLPGAGVFASGLTGYRGTGLQTEVEMMQCIEHESSQTTKDAIGGGQTTVKTYTYTVEWSSSPVDSSAFKAKSSDNFQRNCGAENPSWRSLPSPGSVFAPKVFAGAFVLGAHSVQQVALTAHVLVDKVPAGWTDDKSGFYTTSVNHPGNVTGIGSARVRFLGTDWSKPRVTVLGENQGGELVHWKAAKTWLCSGNTLGELRMGTVAKAELFKAMQADSNLVTLVLRVVGFLLAWYAVSQVFGPLEVAADCIPFVGPYLGDAIDTVICCVSCPPALACVLGVAGVVWVAMRPLVGIPLLLIFVVTLGGYAVFKANAQQRKAAQQAEPPLLVNGQAGP